MPFVLAPGLVLLVVLLAGLLIPLLRVSMARNASAFPGMIATIALFFFVLAGMGPGFDKEHRQSNHVLYTLDATEQRALWVSFDARPDEWTEQFFGKKPGTQATGGPFPRRPASLFASAGSGSRQSHLRKRSCWKMFLRTASGVCAFAWPPRVGLNESVCKSALKC